MPTGCALSVGRDLTLAPRQDGAPLNYFVYPYVEVDGKPFAGVSQSFAYHDLAGSRAQLDCRSSRAIFRRARFTSTTYDAWNSAPSAATNATPSSTS